MRILLTGGAGYLGSVLLPKLLRRGHEVRIVDIGFFGLAHIQRMIPKVDFIREDLIQINRDPKLCDKLLEDVDAVIHLAAMSNDPAADLDPQMTEEINTRTTATLAQCAKKRNIRFTFASSCSVYGTNAGVIDENGSLDPLTTYAISKVKAEQILLGLEDSLWKPMILRFGTLFGYSPRMRFDLVVNIFALFSIQKNEIKVFGDGKHWRPFLHVEDCARAVVYFTELKRPQHSIYNISHENLSVREVAEIYKTLTPNLRVVTVKAESEDLRNYRVSNERMVREGFLTKNDVASGAEELQDALTSGTIPDPESLLYQNVKWLKQLGLRPTSRFSFLKAA